MYQVDPIEQTIIRLLMQDGRMPIPDIARHIPGTSERTIRYRIDQLLEKQVIKLCAIIVPASVGFSVAAEVLLKVEIGYIEPVALKLAGLEMTSYVCATLGNHDVGIGVNARDNTELYTTVAEQISSIPGVKETTIALVPLLFKDIYHWQIPDSVVPSFVPPRTPPFFPKKIIPRKIDRIDWSIIQFLMDDARISAANIARNMDGVSPRTISSRIDSLIRQDVIRVTAVVDPEKVGFPVRADLHIQVESTQILDVAQKLAELEQTSWVACAMGDSDLSVQICVQDVRELYRFVTEVVHKIPGITMTATSLVSRVIKDSYDWRIPDAFQKDIY